MRIFAEEDAHPRAGEEPGVSGPSPGVNKMEFKAPVRPGDTVTYVLGVTGKRNSNSIPGWGLLFNELVATNQRGELVYRAELVSFTKLRDYKDAARPKARDGVDQSPAVAEIRPPLTRVAADAHRRRRSSPSLLTAGTAMRPAEPRRGQLGLRRQHRRHQGRAPDHLRLELRLRLGQLRERGLGHRQRRSSRPTASTFVDGNLVAGRRDHHRARLDRRQRPRHADPPYRRKSPS